MKETQRTILLLALLVIAIAVILWLNHRFESDLLNVLGS
jgi:hypothetical protein